MVDRLARPWIGQIRSLQKDDRGAVLIEAAFALPIVIIALLGVVTYGGWFMAAHSLQQAANDAARAAIAGLNGNERKELVANSLEKSVLKDGTLHNDLVGVETARSGSYFTVKLTYDIKQSGLFHTSLIPLPSEKIIRSSVVQLNEL